MKKHLLILTLTFIGFSVNAQKIFIKNEKYGIKDSLGNVITKAKYDFIEDFFGDITVTRLKDKYGIINSKGIEIVKPFYQEIKEINLFIPFVDVKIDGKWGVLDFAGNVLVNPKYSDPVEIALFSEYTVVALSYATVISSGEEKKKYGAIDNTTYKEIISPKYFTLVDNGFGYFKARTDEKYKKYGLIDVNGKVIFQMEYENIFAISKDIISIPKNKKYVLVNSKGYSISSAEYDNLYKMSGNRAKVGRNGKFGFIDEKGKEVIACKYDEVDNVFYNGKVKVKLNGAKFEIDSNGNEVTVSKTIKPRSSLVFNNEKQEKAFDLIIFSDFKENVKNVEYIDNYLGYNSGYKNIIAAIDNLMSEASNNKLAYKEFANYLYAKYSNSDYACHDAIPIHVSRKYMCDSDAPYGGGYWLSAENKKEICDFGKKYKPTLCGEIISNLNIKLLPQTNSKFFHLDDLKSKYTLLFFWKNDSPKCEKQIQVLASNYEELKKLGVEIIGISGDSEAKDKAEQLIVSNNMDWINTVDIYKEVFKKINVNNAPYIYLLDQEKRILIKGISAQQTIDYLKSHKQ